MKNLIIVIVAGAIILASCINEENKEVVFTEVNGKMVPLLRFEDVTDSIPFLLSDIISDVEFLKLETKKDALISLGNWIVGEKYVIVFIYNQGLYQFTRGGRFIRKLAYIGRGPKEIQYPVFHLSEKQDLIYLIERDNPRYFVRIDLETGGFMENIPLARPGRLQNFMITYDTIINCAPLVDSGMPSGKYYFFRQTTSGNFINGILTGNEEGSSYDNGQDLLYQVGESMHYRPVNSDTVFLVKEDQLEPCFIFEAGNIGLGSDVQIGRTTFSILTERVDFFIINTFTITSKEQMGGKAFRYNGKRHLILVDKINMHAHYISPFYNDFTGEKLNPYYAKFQSDGTFYTVMDAFSLMERSVIVRSDPDLRVKNRDGFLNLSKVLTENDNPVLLIGNVKTLY